MFGLPSQSAGFRLFWQVDSILILSILSGPVVRIKWRLVFVVHRVSHVMVTRIRWSIRLLRYAGFHLRIKRVSSSPEV